MSKSNYLSSAAKYFAGVSFLILITNLFSTVARITGEQQILSLTSKITSFSFYLIILLAFVALNGERIAYRNVRDFSKLKVMINLKRVFFAVVVLNFSSNYIEKSVSSYMGSFALKTVLQVSSSFLFSVSSFSFLVVIVLFWYYKRDKLHGKISVMELTSVIIGIIYNVFKALNFSVTKYQVIIYGKTLESFFLNQNILDALCILSCIIYIVVFISIANLYKKFVVNDDVERKKQLDSRRKTKDVYKSEGYGLDTAEDDFIF